MPRIATTAVVAPRAELADDVVVAPGAIIEDDCTIGGGSEIGAHTIIWRGTQIGRNNRIFPHCSLGGEPQDKKYRGEASTLIIGDNNTIREYCFFNRGTADGGNITRVGDHNWIMAYVHLAHDCQLGSHAIIANCAQFSGHVTIGDGAVIGGGTLFHQFCRIGAGAMIGGGEGLRMDVPPFALIGNGIISVNTEGMRRKGHSAAIIAAMKEAYRLLYRRDLPLAVARAKIAEMVADGGAPMQQLSDFLHLQNLQLLRPAASG